MERRSLWCSHVMMGGRWSGVREACGKDLEVQPSFESPSEPKLSWSWTSGLFVTRNLTPSTHQARTPRGAAQVSLGQGRPRG